MHELDYRCDNCDKGHFRPTGMMLLSDPPKWPHACAECGHQDIFDTKYPALVYRRKEEKSSMNLLPHQQRVVDEKAELDKKATALSNFIGLNLIFKTLDAAEQERQKVQNDLMWRYSEVLGARIAAFGPAA